MKRSAATRKTDLAPPKTGALEKEARAVARAAGDSAARPANALHAFGAGGTRTHFDDRLPLQNSRPLASDLRNDLETRLGADFSMVRVHTDADAAQAAEGMDANAFTYGNDIAFGPGQFAPHSAGGRELLAHELTHTAQQAQSAGPALQMDQKQGKTGIGDAPPAEHFITMNTAGAEDGFVLFGLNSADLTSPEKVLKIIGQPTSPISIHVHGYASTDGNADYNMNLSAHRGVAVKQFLESKLPKGSEVVVFAHGRTKEFGDATRNRRVGISLMGPIQNFGFQPKVDLGKDLKAQPFDKSNDTPDKPDDQSSFKPVIPPIPGPPPPTPKLELTLPPTMTPRHLMDWPAFHASIAGRGFGLAPYGDLTGTWDQMFWKYRLGWGLNDEWAARFANWELSGTLGADAARTNPSPLDRSNDLWKTLHPDDKTIGPIMSPDLLQFFRKKKKDSKP